MTIMSFKGPYKNGKKDGPWVTYNADGTVWKEGTGTFKNGVKVDQMKKTLTIIFDSHSP